MRWAVVVMILALPSTAAASNGYAVLSLTYEGAATTVLRGASEVGSVSHSPRLGFTVYGGDWFLKVRATMYSRPTGIGEDGIAAHFVDAAVGGGEVGVHLPGRAGNLAVGLLVDGKTIGLNNRGRSESWRVGGRGVDGGLAIHYAFPLFGMLRLDPSVAAGVSFVGSDVGDYSGPWAHGELEAILKISDQLSIVVGAGLDLRRYGARDSDEEFDARTIRFGAGIAIHDLLGIGANAF